MKLAEAKAIMNAKPNGTDNKGKYRVHFELHERSCLAAHYFPADDEKPISGLEKAWDLARRFASSALNKGQYVNIYVVHGSGPDIHKPVAGYEKRLYCPHGRNY